MTGWRQRVSAGAMGAFFLSVLAIWGLTSAIEYQWFTRAGMAWWYSWPAAAVSRPLQDSGAQWICSISLGDACHAIAAPVPQVGLSCWAGSAATWCADPTFATATLVWCLLGLAAYIASRALYPMLAALPPDAPPRTRRNHALFQLGLEAVMIVWMVWTVADMIRNPGTMTGAGACVGSSAACVYDVADRLPGALFYVVMVLFGLFSIADTGFHQWRDILYRADPILKAGR
jgi:hypothetical protein